MGKNSKDKDYTHCTISTEYGDYIAQVQFNEIIDAWEPIYVLVDGEWMRIDDFDDTEMGQCYGCEKYRTERIFDTAVKVAGSSSVSLAITDKGDPSVGIFSQTWVIPCPFNSLKDDPELCEWFKEEQCRIYQEFTEFYIEAEFIENDKGFKDALERCEEFLQKPSLPPPTPGY